MRNNTVKYVVAGIQLLTLVPRASAACHYLLSLPNSLQTRTALQALFVIYDMMFQESYFTSSSAASASDVL